MNLWSFRIFKRGKSANNNNVVFIIAISLSSREIHIVQVYNLGNKVVLFLEITSWPQLFGSQNMMSFQGCKYFKDAQTEPLGRNLLELLSFSAGHRSLLSSSLLSLSLLSFSAPCRDKRQHGL